MEIRVIYRRITGPISILILFMYFTSACGPDGNTNQEVLIQATQVPTLIQTTQALQRTVIPSTKTPPIILTVSPIASFTPFPTIHPSDIPNYVHDLIHNDNCRLPCWWGIVPNKSNWKDAWQFLSAFAEQIGDGFVQNIPTEDGTYTITKYTVLYKISNEEKGGTTFSVMDGTVKNIEIDPTGMEEFYPLSRLLSILGTPGAIGIATFSDYGSHGQLEFTLLIEYDQIRAFYNFEGEKNGDIILTCLKSQLVGPRLELGEQQTDKDSVSSSGILSIETATGMSIEAFMLQFQDPKNDLCLETSAELWP